MLCILNRDSEIELQTKSYFATMWEWYIIVFPYLFFSYFSLSNV